MNPKLKSDRLEFITAPLCVCLTGNVCYHLNLELTLIFGGYQLDVIPEVGPVCVHADVCGKVSSFPGPQRILSIADPCCRIFTVYL